MTDAEKKKQELEKQLAFAMARDAAPARSNFDLRDEALETLNSLKGMFGAVSYLMGGHKSRLEGEDEDLDLWFSDIRDRLNNVIETVGEMN